jgi:hypothetical protein
MLFVVPVLLTIPSLIAAQTAQTQPDTAGRAVTEPLRDTGLKKDRIPEALHLAASAPYSLAGTRSCASIAAEIRRLDDALGRDIDAPAERKGESAELGAVAARTAVNALIPGLGLVKVLTGADKAQRRAEAAVYAGSVRRGFLKGIGQARGCRVPAAPLRTALIDQPTLPGDDDKD